MPPPAARQVRPTPATGARARRPSSTPPTRRRPRDGVSLPMCRVPEYYRTPQDQRNDVVTAISDFGMDVSDFAWVETSTRATQVGAGSEPIHVDTLMHKPTGYTFAFDVNLNRRLNPPLYAGMDPGRNGPPELIKTETW